MGPSSQGSRPIRSLPERLVLEDHSGAFDDLIALRPVSESLNSWIKNHQVPHHRAPVVGHARMRIHLLFQALYLNIRATIARMLRTGQQLPFTT